MQKIYSFSTIIFSTFLVAALPLSSIARKHLPTPVESVAKDTLVPSNEEVASAALKAVMDHPSFCCTGNVKTDSAKTNRQSGGTIIYSCIYSCPCVANNTTHTAYEIRLNYNGAQLMNTHINSVMVVNSVKK